MNDVEFYNEYQLKSGWDEPMRNHNILATSPWTHMRHMWNEVVVGVDGTTICKMPTLSPHSIANMRLIAAAPLMLEALLSLRAQIGSSRDAAPLLDAIDRVLIKARGEG